MIYYKSSYIPHNLLKFEVIILKKTKIKALILGLAFSIFANTSIAQAITIKNDFNGDGIVDLKDIAELSKYYSTTNGTYDLNRDGVVDIYDIIQISTSINNSPFKIFSSNGEFIKGYDSGALFSAINEASKIPGAFVMVNGTLGWNSSSYWVYNGDSVVKSSPTAYQAMQEAQNLSSGKVATKLGTVLYDKANNIKNVLGVSSDDVNFRQGPSTSTAKLGLLPNNVLVHVNNIARSFFSTSWIKEDKSVLNGYVYYNYMDIIQDDLNQSFLGYVAAKKESGMDAGAISDNPNDKGGVSCGAFQFAADVGSLDGFITWLQGIEPNYYKILNDARVAEGTYGANFKAAWIGIANNEHDKFYKIQQQYAKKNYYDVFLYYTNRYGYNTQELVKYNATRNMIMSTAIHHGAYGAYNVFNAAGPVTDMNTFIDRVYAERLKLVARTYPPDSPNPGLVAIYNAIKARFEAESAEIKRIYQREISY